MVVYDLDSSQLDTLFEKYSLFQQIGKDNFSIKIWILLKGIEEGDGEGVLLTALGHAPCIAMLEDDVSPLDIRAIMEELLVQGLIVWNDNHMVDHAKKYIVTFETSHELNKIVMQLKWEKYLKDGLKGVGLLTALGYRNVGSAWFDNLKQLGKKYIYFLNGNNGLATGKFILSILWETHTKNLS
jgi:hypothetical protein